MRQSIRCGRPEGPPLALYALQSRTGAVSPAGSGRKKNSIPHCTSRGFCTEVRRLPTGGGGDGDEGLPSKRSRALRSTSHAE